MKKIFFLIPFLMLLSSCLIDSKDNNSDEDFRYPLKVGNHWEYQRRWTNFYYDSTSSEYMDTSSYKSDISLTITEKVQLKNGVKAYKFVGISEETFYSHETVCYYRNNDDGLFYCAYKEGAGSGLFLPKISQNQKVRFGGMHFKNIVELSNYFQNLGILQKMNGDSIVYFDKPQKSLAYPLKVGEIWNFREAGDPWKMEKTVTGRERVQTEAGYFDCFKIVTLYDRNDDGLWDDDIKYTDYVCEAGLVKRVFELKNVGMTVENDPSGGSVYSDVWDVYTLTEVNIEE
jgi:hypothetical protein